MSSAKINKLFITAFYIPCFSAFWYKNIFISEKGSFQTYRYIS